MLTTSRNSLPLVVCFLFYSVLIFSSQSIFIIELYEYLFQVCFTVSFVSISVSISVSVFFCFRFFSSVFFLRSLVIDIATDLT